MNVKFHCVVDVKWVNGMMAKEWNTGSDREALLNSIGNEFFFSDEFGLIVHRYKPNSGSLQFTCISNGLKFVTCAAKGKKIRYRHTTIILLLLNRHLYLRNIFKII